MTYLEAIDALANDPHVWRYRQLVEDENARKRDAWRARIIVMAGGEPEQAPSPAYPSLARQAMSAAKAAAGFVASGFAVASQEEQARRLTLCHACDKYDAVRQRCLLCGCKANLKTRVAKKHCPKIPPLW